MSLAEKTFYSLSALGLGAALFVMQPTYNQNVDQFQSSVKTQFSFAAQEVFGDQPMFASVGTVIASVNEFYNQASDAMIALLSPNETDNGLNYVASATVTSFKTALMTSKPQVAGVSTQNADSIEAQPANFMSEAPIENIVPENYVLPTNPPPLSDVNISVDAQPAQTATWSNMTDNITGQVYCVGIFNAEVNRYVGPCKNDFH